MRYSRRVLHGAAAWPTPRALGCTAGGTSPASRLQRPRSAGMVPTTHFRVPPSPRYPKTPTRTLWGPSKLSDALECRPSAGNQAQQASPPLGLFIPEARQIDFTALERRASTVWKEASRSLWLRAARHHLQPRTAECPLATSARTVHHDANSHAPPFLLQTIFYNRENKLLVITLHAGAN